MIVGTWRRGVTEAMELRSAQHCLHCIVDVRADFTELAEKVSCGPRGTTV